jgi:hypothetical protein
MSLPWARGFTGSLHHVMRGEIGLEEGAEMDVGRSCPSSKGERVWWAPTVGAFFWSRDGNGSGSGQVDRKSDP